MVERGVGVGHDGQIGELHHRAVAVGVHADDVVGVAEPAGVLHGTADPERDVEIGVDDHAGGADLTLVRHPTPVGDHPRRAHTGADGRADPGELVHAGRVVEPGAAADDAWRLGQVDGGRVGR